MLLRGWWIILLVVSISLMGSLGMSYVAVPQYQAVARFIINPSGALTTSSDQLKSLDTLDLPSVTATYVEVMNSHKIYNDALTAMQIKSGDPLLAAYTVQAVQLPSSSVLQLTVDGPNPKVAAQIANAVGNQSINYAKRVNAIYNLEFLDTAVAPLEPFSPQPLRDASLALILGLVGGVILAILKEQIRLPIEALRHRITIDQPSSAYSRRYFQTRLEEEQARAQTGDVGLVLIQLQGLSDLLESLPSILVQQVLREVTRRLRNELRGNDIVGRWSNLDFAVILPSTPVAGAERMLKHILVSLSEPILISQTKELVQLQPIVAVIVSEPQEAVASLVERAENELLEARRRHLAGGSNE